MRRKKFILQEILIVVAILSILSVFAVPKFNFYKERYITKQFINKFKIDIYDTKLKALKQNKKFYIEMKKDKYRIVSEEGTYIGKYLPIPTFFSYQEDSVPNNKLIFDKKGRLNFAGTFSLLNTIDKKDILIEIKEITGKVKIYW